MKLPNGSLALIAKEKVTDYLLNPAHPDNGGKAQFFHSLGFRREAWEVLARAFRRLAAATEVAERLESAHGMKYVLEGVIETPSGRDPRVRTIWIVDRGGDCPRLVTAYPAEA
jgi:Domain of unknown function (DUF6883)